MPIDSEGLKALMNKLQNDENFNFSIDYSNESNPDP